MIYKFKRSEDVEWSHLIGTIHFNNELFKKQIEKYLEIIKDDKMLLSETCFGSSKIWASFYLISIIMLGSLKLSFPLNKIMFVEDIKKVSDHYNIPYNSIKNKTMIDLMFYQKIKPFSKMRKNSNIRKQTVDYKIEKFFSNRKKKCKNLDPILKLSRQMRRLSKSRNKNPPKISFEEFKKTMSRLYNLDKKIKMYQRDHEFNPDDLFDDKNLIKILLTERNKNWIPKILKYHNLKKKITVACGAAHLYGSNGLINLLKDLGFIVEKI